MSFSIHMCTKISRIRELLLHYILFRTFLYVCKLEEQKSYTLLYIIQVLCWIYFASPSQIGLTIADFIVRIFLDHSFLFFWIFYSSYRPLNYRSESVDHLLLQIWIYLSHFTNNNYCYCYFHFEKICNFYILFALKFLEETRIKETKSNETVKPIVNGFNND